MFFITQTCECKHLVKLILFLTQLLFIKGEAGEFHSDAEALASLATKYENLLNRTMKLESQLNSTAKSKS